MGMFLFFCMLVLGAACFGAWLRNIWRILDDARNNRGGMVVARTVGVFIVPLGVMLGFVRKG